MAPPFLLLFLDDKNSARIQQPSFRCINDDIANSQQHVREIPPILTVIGPIGREFLVAEPVAAEPVDPEPVAARTISRRTNSRKNH